MPSIQVQGLLAVARVHDCDPVLVLPAHAPPAQRYEVTARDCVPSVSQVVVNPPQAPHAP